MISTKLFVSSAYGIPAWFRTLQPGLQQMGVEVVYPPMNPYEAQQREWGDEAYEETLLECQVAIFIVEREGTAYAPFSQQVQKAREMWGEKRMRGILYVQVSKPTYVAIDAPPGLEDRRSLAIQAVPGAQRLVLDPMGFPGYIAFRWLPACFPEEEEDEEAQSTEPQASLEQTTDAQPHEATTQDS